MTTPNTPMPTNKPEVVLPELPSITRYRVDGDIAYPVSEDPDGSMVDYDDHVAAMRAYGQACIDTLTRPAAGDNAASATNPKVQRYTWNAHHMVMDSRGPWIVYEDHAATVTALEAEVERLRKYSERVSSELSEMAQVCGEAYQVVGILLDETEQFGSGHSDKILTNLWEGKLIHKDVIPWSFKAARHG